MEKRFARKVECFVLILVTCIILITNIPCNAQFTILAEDFERDSDDWPWPLWTVRPFPPSHPNYTWGVEDSLIFHNHGYRSAWCSGKPNGLLPGQDEYLGNQNSWMRWGPFDLTDAVSAIGSFWVFCDTEPLPDGDALYVLVTNSQQDQMTEVTHRNLWVHADTVSGSTAGMWMNYWFEFADLDSANEERDSICYLGRDNIYIAFCFQSDSDNNHGLGVFIDDIYIGYDAGGFDLNMESLAFYDLIDTTSQLSDTIIVGQEVAFVHSFWNCGPEQPASARNVLYMNDEIVDEISGTWESDPGGILHRLWFTYSFIAEETGVVEFRCELDVDNSIEEYDETNNTYTASLTIVEPQTPPVIEWITPTEEGLAHTDSVEIIYIPSNSPPSEEATISFFWDDDSEGFNGAMIAGAQGLPVTNEEESLYWNLQSIPFEHEVYLYAVMDDNTYEPQYYYAPGPVIHEVGVNETPDGSLPDEFRIVSVYPNPFNPTVEVSFSLPSPGTVQAAWYSMDGRQIDQQVYHQISAGMHSITWTPEGIASGLYFLRLQTSDSMLMTKVIYIK